MAIDPRIALEARAPDISGVVSTFQNALLNAQKGRQNEQVLQQANVMNPLLAQQAQQGIDINTQNIAAARNEARFKNIYQTSQMLKPFITNNDAVGAEQFVLKNISRLQDAKARGEDVDLTESLEALEQIKAGNLQGVSQNIAAIEGIAQQRMNKGMSAGQREFQYHMGVYNDPKSDTKTKLASGIFLGLDPRVGSSAAERTATDPDLGQAIINQATNLAQAESGVKVDETQQIEDIKTTQAGRKGAIAAATSFAKSSNDKISGIRDLTDTYALAIEQLDAGAKTGKIYSMLPSFDTNALILENIASQAGFNMAKSGGGIITDADMKFGMRTAIPQNLGPAELKDFLTKKLAAQNKIINHLREVTMFLGDGTKTLPDWYKKQASVKKDVDIFKQYGLK